MRIPGRESLPTNTFVPPPSVHLARLLVELNEFSIELSFSVEEGAGPAWTLEEEAEVRLFADRSVSFGFCAYEMRLRE